MTQKNYNTNLSAEFYVLSMLHRKGFPAALTLGNAKAVDIIIDLEGKLITLDVKGLAGKTCWPMDNFKKVLPNHFIVLVCFMDKISDEQTIPECWIIPSNRVERLLYRNPKGNRQVINRHKIRKLAPELLENWNLLKGKTIKIKS